MTKCYPSALFASLLSVVGCVDTSTGSDSRASEMCGGPCEIALDTLAALGAPGDSIWPSPLSRPIRTSTGEFVVGGTDHPQRIAVYSPDGHLVRTFGKSGNGPGEFSSNYLLPFVGHGDTISIIDILQGRRTLVDRNGEVLRTHPIPGQVHQIATLGKRTLVQADIRSPSRRGWLLHELDTDGSVIHSHVEVAAYRTVFDGIAPVAASVDGGLWLASTTQYRITHYDTTFAATRVIEPQVKWFPPNGGDGDIRYERPEPFVSGLMQTPDSILWVLIRTADASWKPDPEFGGLSVNRIGRMFDWRLEAIDPASGTRLGALVLDRMATFGMGDHVLYQFSEAPDGRVVLTASSPRTRMLR